MSGLESGSIEAANFNPPFLYFAKRRGFRELLDLGVHAQMPLGGLTASNAAIQNRAAELKRVIRSMQSRGGHYFSPKKRASISSCAQSRLTGKPRKTVSKTIGRPPAAAVFRAGKAWRRSSNHYSCWANSPAKKLPSKKWLTQESPERSPGSSVTRWTSCRLLKKPHMLRGARPISRQRTRVRLRSSIFARLASESFLSSLQILR